MPDARCWMPDCLCWIAGLLVAEFFHVNGVIELSRGDFRHIYQIGLEELDPGCDTITAQTLRSTSYMGETYIQQAVLLCLLT